MTRSNLIEKLDRVFSQFIRLEASDDNGYCKCISCGRIDHWKDLHCGYYIDRRHMNTRYDVDNCNPQCPTCNVGLSGNLPSYLEAIGETLGEELTRRKYKIKKFTRDDLLHLIDLYSDLVKTHKKEKI